MVSSLGFYKSSLFSNFHHLSLCQTLSPQDTKVAETLQLRVGCLPSPSPWSPSLPRGSRTLQKPNLHQQGHRGSWSCVELSPRNGDASAVPLPLPTRVFPHNTHWCNVSRGKETKGVISAIRLIHSIKLLHPLSMQTLVNTSGA